MKRINLTQDGMRFLNKMNLRFKQDPLDEKLWYVMTTEENIIKFLDFNDCYMDENNDIKKLNIDFNLKVNDNDYILGFFEGEF